MWSRHSAVSRILLSAVASAALLVGCKSPPKAPEAVPRELVMRIESDRALNPDSRDRAAPVVVRIYQLRSPLSFQAADFFALFDDDRAALGEDLVARDELQVRPGASLQLAPRELKPEARALGVFAAFRDLEHSRWRAVIGLPDPPPPVTEPPARPLAVPVTVTLGPRDVQAAAQ